MDFYHFKSCLKLVPSKHRIAMITKPQVDQSLVFTSKNK